MPGSLFKINRRNLFIGLIIALVIVSLGFLVFKGVKSGKIRLRADISSTITNMATVTYQDAAGTSYTVQSNPVETQITTPTGTIDLSADPATINSGDSSTLTWAITIFTASQCTATPSGWWTNSLTGTAPVSPASTATYTLSCTDGTTPVSQSAVVTVNGTPTQVVNITFALDARPTTPAIDGAKMEVYTTGSVRGVTPPVLTKTGLNSDATGHFNNIDVTGLAIATNYDYYLFATPFVGIKKAVATDIFPLSLTFTATGQQLLGGDANGDGLIDDSDYAIFLLSDIRSDINGSGGIDANDVWWIKKNYTIN